MHMHTMTTSRPTLGSLKKTAALLAAFLFSLCVCAAAQAAGSAKPPANAAPIDINSATAEQLQTVPGISASIAKKIIAGRPYTSKYDIVRKGFISQKLYESIKAQLAAKWGTAPNAAGKPATSTTTAAPAPADAATADADTSPLPKNTATTAPADEKELALSIREIIDKYYKGVFWMGGAPNKNYQDAANRDKLAIFQKEFPYVTPANAFKQSTVYLESGAEWKNQEYMKWIELARANNQVIRCHGPTSPQCSTWAKDPARTPKELLATMTYHMTRLSDELEKNKDVVRWMDVVNETVVTPETVGGGRYKKGDWFGPLEKGVFWQNPWLKIGIDPKSGIPLYILMAFDIANKHAPSIKKIYNQNGGGKDAVAWDKIKKTILYLRSIGQRVDGLGWQAHVDLGWEKDPANKRGISALIDWCHANNLEFHITELDVSCPNESSWKNDRKAQAATIKAVVDTALEKVGQGAVAINFWDINSGKRNLSGNKMKYFGGVWPLETDYNDPVYVAIKRSLLEHAKTNPKSQ